VPSTFLIYLSLKIQGWVANPPYYWHLTIGFGPDQTLNIQDYFIMDFAGFADMENSGGGEN